MRARHAALAPVIALLAACAAAPPPPIDALEAAEVSVRHADEAQAGEYAAEELASAHEKLASARTAAAKKDEDDRNVARKLAEEARADADLATAKASAARQQAANLELKKSNETLWMEMQRNGGQQ